MRKRMLTAALAAVMVLAASMTAFAGQWQQDGAGWRYQNDNGTYTAGAWQWIDGNNDGTAECYYFDASGAMLANTTTPDGYTVDADGAWTENGVKKTQAVETQEVKATGGLTTRQIMDVYSDYNENTGKDDTPLIVDTSRQESASGATNIKYEHWDWKTDNDYYQGNGANGGWFWLGTRNGVQAAVAFDKDGYLLVNTTTPDGYQVDALGVALVDGQEVYHSGCDTYCWWMENHPRMSLESEVICPYGQLIVGHVAETVNVEGEFGPKCEGADSSPMEQVR